MKRGNRSKGKMDVGEMGKGEGLGAQRRSLEQEFDEKRGGISSRSGWNLFIHRPLL